MIEQAWDKACGRRMRERRRMLGLTLDDLADRAGVSAAAVARWEQGGKPSLASLTAASVALSCTGWYLLRKVDDPAGYYTEPEWMRKRLIAEAARTGDTLPLLKRGALPWHFCPVCGFEAPAVAGHEDGCPAEGLEELP